MKRLICLVPIVLLGLPACAPVDRGYGETVRFNMARQTLNPDPAPPTPGAPIEGGSGAKADKAATRYETDTVKQPGSVSTGGGG
jgi:hypothetical protein